MPSKSGRAFGGGMPRAEHSWHGLVPTPTAIAQFRGLVEDAVRGVTRHISAR